MRDIIVFIINTDLFKYDLPATGNALVLARPWLRPWLRRLGCVGTAMISQVSKKLRFDPIPSSPADVIMNNIARLENTYTAVLEELGSSERRLTAVQQRYQRDVLVLDARFEMLLRVRAEVDILTARRDTTHAERATLLEQTARHKTRLYDAASTLFWLKKVQRGEVLPETIPDLVWADCIICADKVNQLESVFCNNVDTPHAVCRDCVNVFVKSRREPENLLKHGCTFHCPFGTDCTSVALSHDSILKHLTPAGRTDFEYVLQEVAEMRVRREALKHAHESGSHVEIVAAKIQNIIDCVLQCPNPACGAVYDSVTRETTCMAAHCSACNNHFCAFCWLSVEGDGVAVHSHVRNCMFNPSTTRDMYCDDKAMATKTVQAVLIARLLAQNEPDSSELLNKVNISSLALANYFKHSAEHVSTAILQVRSGALSATGLHTWSSTGAGDDSEEDMRDDNSGSDDSDSDDDDVADPNFFAVEENLAGI